MAGTRLSNKQRVFVEEYLKCWNASEAARRAGYKGRADSVGSQLLVNIGIQALIKARLTEKTMSADEALARLTEQARGSIQDFIDIDARTGEARLDFRAAQTAGKLHLIKSYQEPSEKFGGKLELQDQQRALELIGKHLRLFDTQVALNLDVADLSDEQLRRIADGEDPIKVISANAPTTAGAGGNRTEATPGDEGRLGGAAV